MTDLAVRNVNNKRKGAAAESAVEQWARLSWPGAIVVRPRLAGINDIGDVLVFRGDCCYVYEVKSAARLDIPGWLRELDAEVLNACAKYGMRTVGSLLVKPRGVGLARVSDWWEIRRPVNA